MGSEAIAERAPAPPAADKTPSSKTRCWRTFWRWAAVHRALAAGCDRIASAACPRAPLAGGLAEGSLVAPKQI